MGSKEWTSPPAATSSNPTDFKLNHGDKVRDAISGYTGIIVARTQWIHNCNTYGVKTQELENGKPIDAVWFDEPQLEVLAEKTMPEKRDTGGPCEAVQQTNR